MGGRPRGMMPSLIRHEPDIETPGDNERGRWNEEGPAPADGGNNESGNAARDRNAHVSEHAVPRHRPGPVHRCVDQRRQTNRMIDRGEHTDSAERDGEYREARRQTYG